VPQAASCLQGPVEHGSKQLILNLVLAQASAPLNDVSL
jgi:hypothetical protein